MATLTAPERKALAVVEKHSTSRQSILLALLKALFGLWDGFDGWDNRDLVFGHAARSAVLVDASLAKTRRLARTYSTTMLRNADAMPKKAMPQVVDLYPRSGTSQSDAYSRAADVYLWEKKKGGTEAQARAAVRRRLQALASTDIMLVERDETQLTFARAPKVIGRRRVIHPELSASGFSCGLCVVISTRIYRVSELSAVHDGCNCTDAPITAGFDPADALNQVDLEAFYDAAGSTFAEDLVNVRVTVNEHGELGPVLRRDGDSFRDPEDASSGRRKFTKFEPRTLDEQRASWKRMVDRSQRSIEILEQSKLAGESTTDFTTAIKFHRDLISRYQKALAN